MVTLLTFNGHTFGIAWFVADIKRELVIDDRAIALVWGGALVAAAACLPLAGRLIDRVGPLRVLLAVSLPFGGAVAAMGAVRSEATLLLVIAAMRFLGPGVVLVATSKAINMWFVKKRGRVGVILVARRVILQRTFVD